MQRLLTTAGAGLPKGGPTGRMLLGHGLGVLWECKVIGVFKYNGLPLEWNKLWLYPGRINGIIIMRNYHTYHDYYYELLWILDDYGKSLIVMMGMMGLSNSNDQFIALSVKIIKDHECGQPKAINNYHDWGW